MADITPVLADFRIIGGRAKTGVSEEALAALRLVYWTGTTWAAATAGDTEEKAAATAITLHACGAAGDTIVVMPLDREAVRIDLGAAATKDTTYVLSASAGGLIAPKSDLTTDDWITLFGIAEDTGWIRSKLLSTGTQHS